MKRLVVILALVPLFIIAACAPAEDGGALDADTLQAEGMEEMENFRMEVETSLADIDEGIDSLEVQAETAGEDVQSELQTTIAELREERDSLQQDLQQLEASGEAGVEDIRADIEMRLDELEADLQAARERFSENNVGATTS